MKTNQTFTKNMKRIFILTLTLFAMAAISTVPFEVQAKSHSSKSKASKKKKVAKAKHAKKKVKKNRKKKVTHRAKSKSRGVSTVTLKTHLPKSMCRKGAYFRECFSVNQKQCETTISKVTASCLRKNNSLIKASILPVSFIPQIGSCVGQQSMQKLSGDQLSKPSCDRPKNWL